MSFVFRFFRRGSFVGNPFYYKVTVSSSVRSTSHWVALSKTSLQGTSNVTKLCQLRILGMLVFRDSVTNLLSSVG